MAKRKAKKNPLFGRKKKKDRAPRYIPGMGTKMLGWEVVDQEGDIKSGHTYFQKGEYLLMVFYNHSSRGFQYEIWATLGEGLERMADLDLGKFDQPITHEQYHQVLRWANDQVQEGGDPYRGNPKRRGKMAKRRAKKNPPAMTSQEVIDAYRGGRRDFTNLELTGVSLKNVDLTGSKFDHSELAGADFSGATLEKADFVGAKLEGAGFTGAGMRGATFSHAKLDNATMIGAQAEMANFINAQMNNVDLSSANMNEAAFSFAKMNDIYAPMATFVEARFWETDLTGAHLNDAVLVNAQLSESNLTDAKLSGARIQGSDFTDANLSQTIYALVPLVGAKAGPSGDPEKGKSPWQFPVEKGDVLNGTPIGLKVDWKVIDVSKGTEVYLPTLLLETVGLERPYRMSFFSPRDSDGHHLLKFQLSLGIQKSDDPGNWERVAESGIDIDIMDPTATMDAGLRMADQYIKVPKVQAAKKEWGIFSDPDRPTSEWLRGATEEGGVWEFDGWKTSDVNKREWQKRVGEHVWLVEIDDLTRPGDEKTYYSWEARRSDRPRDRRYGSDVFDRKVAAMEILGKVETAILAPNPRNKNPSSKKVTKRKATKRTSKSADALIKQAEHLWKIYDNKPLKKNLMAFGKHLGVMKHSKSAKVQKDRRDGMRAFNAEMKLHGWKMPKENPCLGLHFHKEDAEALLEAAKKVQGNPKRRGKKVSKRRRKKNPDLVFDDKPEIGWHHEGDIFDWTLIQIRETGYSVVAILRTEGYQIVVVQPEDKGAPPSRALWHEGEEDRSETWWKLHEEDLPPGTFPTTLTDEQLMSAIQWAEFWLGAEAVGYDPEAREKKQLGQFMQAGLRRYEPTEEQIARITGKGPDIFAGMREGTGTLVKRNPKRRKKVSKKRTRAKKSDPLISRDEMDLTEAYSRMKKHGGTLEDHMTVIKIERCLEENPKRKRRRKAKKNPGWYRDPMSGSLERTWQDFGLDYFDEGKRYTSGFRDDLDEQRARFLLDRAYAAAWLHHTLKQQASLSPMMEQEALEVEEDLSWLLQDISENFKHIKGGGRTRTEFFWVPKSPKEDDRVWTERRKIQTKTPEEAARKIYLQVFGRRTKMPPKPRRRRKNPRKNPGYKQQIRMLNYAGFSLAEIKEGPNYIRLDTAGDTWVMFHEDEQNPGRWWWERFEDDEVIASDEKRTTFSQAYVNAILTPRAKRDAGR